MKPPRCDALTPQSSHVCSRALALATIFAGCASSDPAPDDGSLRVGLWGDGASGEMYSLREADFRITGNGFDATVDADALPDGTPAFTIGLAAGDYQIELLDGWEVWRGAVGDPMPVQVEAALDTDNPVTFAIADNLATDVTFVVDVGGELVPMVAGSLDVDVDFSEDDGVCMPTFLLEEIFESNGGFVDQGDGWQSFTAPADAQLVSVGLFWNVSFNDAFTINVYAGVGNGGQLLHTETFPGLGNAPPVDFDNNLLTTPVLLQEGQSYTIEGVDTFGWQTAAGALPGSTSSLGTTRHKNIRLLATACE